MRDYHEDCFYYNGDTIKIIMKVKNKADSFKIIEHIKKHKDVEEILSFRKYQGVKELGFGFVPPLDEPHKEKKIKR